LQVAARHGNLDVVKLFLKQGVDIDAQELKGQHTAIMRAAAFGKKAVVKYLLNEGANTSLLTKGEWSAFSLATRYGHLEIAKLLFKKGLDIDQRTKKGWTPLMLAVRGEHPDIVKYLLEQGATKNLTNDGMKTALDLTKKYKNKKVIALLN
jgi:ankyrin repeat protein